MNIDKLKKDISISIKDTLKKYNFNDSKINDILESLNSYMDEGIEFDDETHIVSFNPNHQEYVDTNDPWNPKPIYNEVEGYKVISIFKRKETEDRYDGNPLIYALKGLHGWKFSNPSYDIFTLLRRFVAVTKELKEKFDVIITIPSSNKLNTEVLYRVKKLITCEHTYTDFFQKLDANDVYEGFLNTDWFDTHCKNKEEEEKIHKLISRSIRHMNLPKNKNGNDGIFSYKFLGKPLRNAIIQSMYINDIYKDEITYGKYLNDKKILVIDDTVTSGKTISDSADAILETYAPKSITFLTLFSPLTKN
mgnify:CR=1 FL=1